MASETVQYCVPPSFDSNANITFGDDFPFPIPFLFNVSENHSHPLLDNFTTDTVPGEKLYRDIMYYCYDIILPIIFVFGVIGNVLNIIIFSKSRFRHSLDEVEKSATAGKLVNSVLNPATSVPVELYPKYYLVQARFSVLELINLSNLMSLMKSHKYILSD